MRYAKFLFRSSGEHNSAPGDLAELSFFVLIEFPVTDSL